MDNNSAKKDWCCALLCYFCIKVVTMADRINELIKTIGEKVSSLKSQLSVEKTKSESLHNELESLKGRLKEKENEVQSHISKINDLKSEIENGKKQYVSGSTEGNVSDDQIDELVKEIEYCIGQLKK